jgi:hypothetical protein
MLRLDSAPFTCRKFAASLALGEVELEPLPPFGSWLRHTRRGPNCSGDPIVVLSFFNNNNNNVFCIVQRSSHVIMYIRGVSTEPSSQ